jgi:hypothetical protein
MQRDGQGGAGMSTVTNAYRLLREMRELAEEGFARADDSSDWHGAGGQESFMAKWSGFVARLPSLSEALSTDDVQGLARDLKRALLAYDAGNLLRRLRDAIGAGTPSGLLALYDALAMMGTAADRVLASEASMSPSAQNPTNNRQAIELLREFYESEDDSMSPRWYDAVRALLEATP